MSLNSALDNSLNNSIIVASKNQISSNLGSETVILDLKSGQYYGLNNVGSSVWQLIQQPRNVQEIRTHLMVEYEVNIQECHSDLQLLLKNLVSFGLVELVN